MICSEFVLYDFCSGGEGTSVLYRPAADPPLVLLPRSPLPAAPRSEEGSLEDSREPVCYWDAEETRLDATMEDLGPEDRMKEAEASTSRTSRVETLGDGRTLPSFPLHVTPNVGGPVPSVDR